jgi:cell division protein FtsI (penicillin-binding protein 3)
MKPSDVRLNANGLGLHRLTELVWGVEHAFERAKAQARPEEDTRVRIFLVLAAFGVAFGVLSLGAARAALFGGSDGGLSAPVAAASRADVVDREGRLIATNLVHYGLYVDPDEVWDAAETRRALLAAMPELKVEKLQKALNGERRSYVIGGLTPQQRARVHALGLPGVSFEEEDKRVYPLGVSAAHLIGFSDSGGRGLAGVERALDKEIQDAGRAGAPVQLSNDLRVQAALEDELRTVAVREQANGAVGLVTDVKTGEILGMASWPEYDPNAPAAASDSGRLNRAASSVYEMGSTFKVFTVAAGLDSGVASMSSTFDASAPMKIGGRAIHDHDSENRVMSLQDVFIHSSNIGTSKLALSIGADTMTRYFGALGLFQPADIELAESARPIVPRRWDENTLASASFGHAVSVTPVQVAAAMGAVLNGGEFVPLTVRKLKPGEQPQRRRVISAATSRAMLDLMRLNVVRGTGVKANAPGLSVGGKTGSAEKVVGGRYARDKVVASFAAVFPTDGPLEQDRYFVLVLVDEPKGSKESFGLRTAAWNAAPAAGHVIDRIAPFLGVKRRVDTLGGLVSDRPVDDSPSGGGER